MAFSAMAFITVPFPGWNLLAQKSSDIIVARCVNTPDPFNVWSDGRRVDFQGLIDSDFGIVSVLKGMTNTGAVRVTSEYWPRQGEYYLVVANYHDGYYQANEEYRVIPLGVKFPTNSIVGKPLDEQLQILFKRRLNDLNRQMKAEQEEKQRLEEGLKK